MKIDFAALPVEVSGLPTGPTAKIALTPKTFQLLSASLYSDPVLAIVRELTCNAVDAHSPAGIPDRPVVLRLPNRLDPHFKVRDFGLALPPGELPDLYLTYFGSDPEKTKSNAMIGGFGLGSKSPFAYTDSFQVISRRRRDDGRVDRHDFVVYKNSDGIPCLSNVANSVVDAAEEPAGLEVIIPVKNEDFYHFARAASAALKYITPRPIVNGNSAFAITEPDYKYRTATCGLSYTSNYSNKINVIMGGVCYPLDTIKMSKSVAKNWTFPGGFMHSNTEVDLFVPIGAVSPTMSREHLEYNDATIETLRQTLDQASAEVRAHITTQLDACPSLWDARLWFKDNERSGHFFSGGNKKLWKGQDASAILEFSPGGNCAFPIPPDEPSPLDPTVRRYQVDKHYYTSLEVSALRYRKGVRGGQMSHRDEGYTYYVTDHLAAVFCDDTNGKGRFAAADRWLREKYPHTYFEKHALIIPEAALTPAVIAKAGFAHLVVKLSSVPKPVVYRTKRAKSEKTVLRRFALGGFHGANAQLENASSYDLNTGGIYVELCRETCYRTEPDYSKTKLFQPERFSEVMRLYLALTGQPLVAYGIRTGDMHKLKKAAKPWVQLDEHVRETVRSFQAALTRPAVVHFNVEDHEKTCSATDLDRYRDLKTERFPKDSLFGQYTTLREAQLPASRHNVLTAFIALTKCYGATFPDFARVDPEFDALHRAVLAAYPLLRVSDHSDAATKKAWRHYVELIDAERRAKAITEAPHLSLVAS